MIKPEWGTKRTCPKCGTRFYDLGAEDPVTCISCGTAWVPEPILKSKQPLPFGEPEKKDTDADADLSEDLEIDEDSDNPEEDVDLGGDDDLGVTSHDSEEEN